MVTGGDPRQAPEWGLVAQWQAMIDAGDSRFTRFASLEEMAEPVARLVAAVTHRAWVMSRNYSITRCAIPPSLMQAAAQGGRDPLHPPAAHRGAALPTRRLR